jgi:hypothetical protein
MKIQQRREEYFDRPAMLAGSTDRMDSEEELRLTIGRTIGCLKAAYERDTISLSDLAEWKLIAHFYDLVGLKWN